MRDASKFLSLQYKIKIRYPKNIRHSKWMFVGIYMLTKNFIGQTSTAIVTTDEFGGI